MRDGQAVASTSWRSPLYAVRKSRRHGVQVMGGRPARGAPKALYLLFAIPYLAMMAVPSYDRLEPEMLGVPFFYWYQLVWIALGALVLLPAWLAERRRNGRR